MKKYEGKELVLVIFESIMAIFYVVLGVSLFFWQWYQNYIPNQTMRFAIGAVLLLYGFFRVYRAIRNLF